MKAGQYKAEMAMSRNNKQNSCTVELGQGIAFNSIIHSTDHSVVHSTIPVQYRRTTPPLHFA